MLMDSSKQINSAVDELSGKLKELAKFIHSHPEFGFEENQSSKAVADFLEAEGFAVKHGVSGMKTALIASYGDASKGPRVATLAEYDALPGLGHGCGHNLIAASACGAAAAIRRAFPTLPGEMLCIGTPAEETGGGKVIMAKDGVFDGLDAVMLTHPSNKTAVFKLALGVAPFKIRFLGKSAHAAAWPERGVNALDAMILFFTGVNALRQQFPPYARVHGIITHGGDAANIIPERTEAAIMVRALDRDTLNGLIERVKNIVEGAAKSTGCRFEIEAQDFAYLPFHPNRVLGNLFRESLDSLGVKIEQGREDEEMGSSDVGNVCERAPTIHPDFRIGADNVINHTPEFTAQAATDEGLNATLNMAKAMAMTAAKIFEQPELAKEIRAEFKKR